MSLRYILGTASSGKTKQVLKEITSNLKKGKKLIYIVPEQFTLQSESNLINISGEMAILQVQVLSFNRLSFRVFSEVGFNREKTINTVGKNMLLRKLTMELSDELVYYNKSIDKHGFIDDMSHLITELYQYGVSPDALRFYADKPQTNRLLSDKLFDIVRIYEEYNNYIHNGCITSDDSLDYLAQVINESQYLKNSYIWIDGFYGFTPQELKIIGHLLTKADELTVALTVDDTKIKYDSLSEYDVFNETKQTINSLTALAQENNIRINPPVFINSEGYGQLAHLKKVFFKPFDEECELKDNQIYISAHNNFYDEVEYTASCILHLVRDKNYRFNNIAISAANLSIYKKIIKGIFSQYGIPVFIDDKDDVLSHPLTEVIRSIIDIVVKRWSYESVFRLLKTNMFPIDKCDLFDFENYCLEFGIGEGKWRYETWTAGFQNNRYDKEKINAVKDLIKEKLLPFTSDLKRTAMLNIKEFSSRIFAVLEGLSVTETLTNWIDEASREGNSLLARKHKQIWNLICHVFDEMAEILGNEEMTVKEFAKILDSGLASIDMGLIPPSKDQVIIGDLKRTRLPDIKALFIIGLNDGMLLPDDSGVLIDSEKSTMRENGIKLSASVHQKMLRQELYIYSLFSKPSDYLLISCPTGNLDGKTLYPSTVIGRLKAIFPNTNRSFLPENFIKTKETMLKETGTLLNRLKNKSVLNEVELSVLDFYKKDDAYEHVLISMNKLVYGETIEEKLSPETVDKLYGKEIISNVSLLENYIQCPFSYFVKYNLMASERKVYQVDYIDLGNLFHAVLEEFSRLLDFYSLTWKSLDEKLIRNLVNESLNVVIKNDTREIYGATGANSYLLERVSRIVEKSIWALSEHIKMGDFTPYGMELQFTSEAITGITVEIGEGKKFRLTGRIDRVDVMDFNGKLFIKIIDYKTGLKKFSLEDVFYGMQLQLMLYLDFFIKTTKVNPEKLPGGIFYFNINNPILNSEELNFTSSNLDEFMVKELNEKILSKFKMSGLMLADTAIAKGIDNSIESNVNKWSHVVNNVQLSSESETGFSKNSSVAILDEFTLLQEYVNYKILETGNDIVQGKINKNPFKNSKITGCDYCKFSAICQFDLIYETKKYRNFKSFGTVGEVVEEIQKSNNIYCKDDK